MIRDLEMLNTCSYEICNFAFTYAYNIRSIFGRRAECAVERIERSREPAWAGSEEAEYIAGGSFVIPAFCHGKRVGLSKLMLKRFVCAHVVGIYCCIICAKQPKQKRRYYAGAVFTSCAMEQNRSPFGINSAYYSAYAYGGVFGKNYAAVYFPHPFSCALLTAVVTGKYIVHLIFKSTFALGEFPAPAFRNLNMNIVSAGKSGIGMKTAFIFTAHIKNRAELTKSRSIADTPQCA